MCDVVRTSQKGLAKRYTVNVSNLSPELTVVNYFTKLQCSRSDRRQDYEGWRSATRPPAAARGRKSGPGHTNRWTVLHTSLTCAWLRECDWLKEDDWLKEKESAARPTLPARKSGMSAHLREDDANV